MNSKVLMAIFKRNLVSYFSNPTGYVFICVFVMASSIAAIWPNDFLPLGPKKLPGTRDTFDLLKIFMHKSVQSLSSVFKNKKKLPFGFCKRNIPFSVNGESSLRLRSRLLFNVL